MPSVYDEKTKQLYQTEAQNNRPTLANRLDSQGDTSKMYDGMNNVSAYTRSQLGKYERGYEASDAVTNAQNYLNQVNSQRPADYQSSYKDTLNSLFDQIQNRKDFSYNLNGDMLWQQYKDAYMQSGKQAMVDATANAAALTGGYGNSYAAQAGNQAYQQYLTQMTGMIPELYDRAAAADQQQVTNLQNKYALAQNADATDYGRYQDQMTQWNNDRSYGQSAYESAYDRDYNMYNNALNYWSNQAQAEQSAMTQQQTYYYNIASQLLAKGKMPTDQVLQLAGLTKATAQQLMAQKSSGGGSGSSAVTGGASNSYARAAASLSKESNTTEQKKKVNSKAVG